MAATTAKTGIIGYGMGNIASLYNAFRAIGADVSVARTPAELALCSHIVLPGVGAFPNGMKALHDQGFTEELHKLVGDQGRLLLGVCLGMQLLASQGEEHEPCAGLGFIPGIVTRLPSHGLRIPHVGWNDTRSERADSLLGETGSEGCFYYVHSFHLVASDPADVSLTCDYGTRFTSGVRRGNVMGVQFHPEKSHAAGLNLLRAFVECPA